MDKLTILQNELKRMGRVAIAYSSGVDSTFLLLVAVNTLGRENVLAVTAHSSAVPKREISEAEAFCRSNSISHLIVDFDMLSVEGIENNPVNRCYLCKKSLFKKIIQLASENGFSYVLEGSNFDDCSDYRPGMKAVEELGVCSPLKDAQLTKMEIRNLSKEMNLPTWKKPSFACLASRLVYGEQLTAQKLSMVEQAEEVLLEMGVEQFRVRVHGDNNYLARIEVSPDDIEKLAGQPIREQIAHKYKEIGFTYVALDMLGYKTGNMNQFIDSIN